MTPTGYDGPAESRSETPAPQGGAAAGGQAGPAKGRAVKQRARHEFESWARTYDRSIVQHVLFRPAYQLLLEELFRWRCADDEPFDMLDVGSGTGSWAAMVAASSLPAGNIIGLDYAESMCRVAQEKAQSIEQHALRFLNGDSEHLPFSDASFDLVTCSHSFHHYPHQRVVIGEMYRVLRPGGRLMLLDGFRDNIIGWFVFDVLITRGESLPGAKVFHPPWSTIREYFEHAGFRNIRQRKCNIWAPLLLTIGVA
ncbi:MAG: methyltransferase domain-containing protein [Planctomycetota bacterium]